MECVFCKGKVQSKNVTFIYEHDNHVFLIENVPAEVCEKCGEKTYSPEITDEIIKFAKRRFKPVKLVEIPVFDYWQKAEATAGL
jgi:HTH-type transcriptional regulator / antitoxin MqsA